MTHISQIEWKDIDEDYKTAVWSKQCKKSSINLRRIKFGLLFLLKITPLLEQDMYLEISLMKLEKLSEIRQDWLLKDTISKKESIMKKPSHLLLDWK